MGNNCQTSLCKEPDAEIHHQASPSYVKISQSQKIQYREFPQNLIPQTVEQKINLLNLHIDLQNSEVWRYQQPDFTIYTVVNNEDIRKQVGQQSSQNVIANVRGSQQQQGLRQMSRKFDSQTSQKAAIFIFKSEPSSHKTQENQSSSNYQGQNNQNLILEEVYCGPVNSHMNAQNATRIFRNGQYYQGNVKNRVLDGVGLMKNALGNHIYEGQWKNNKPDGQGVESVDGQFKYVGKFRNGKWSGPGKLTLLNNPNQIRLQGNFSEGTLEGLGKIFDKQNNQIYEGQFKNGKQHGRGKWMSPQGDIYEGEFVQGRKQGNGRFVFASGTVYEGNFKNGKPDGEGYLIKNGVSKKGFWYNGQNVLVYPSVSQ